MKEQNIIVKTLTIRSLRKNKGRNLAAILAIILTTMMFTTLFTLAQSMGKNMTEMYLHQSGTKAHATGKGISDEEAEKIASHPDVASSGRSIVVGLAENLRLAGRQVEIRYGEDQYAKDGFAWPETGRMPERKDEIALDTLVAERLGIEPKLGEQVTLEWRKDTRLEEQTSDTFTLCGLLQSLILCKYGLGQRGFRKRKLRRRRRTGRRPGAGTSDDRDIFCGYRTYSGKGG